ncbi:ankyrin repeat-containing domain protein [Aspergillus aurantiobrunneus]
MRLLIEAKADINAVDNTGHTPLHIAAMLPGIEVTLILLANGAAVNVADLYGRTPLFFARQVGNTQVVRLLEEHQDFVAQQAWRYCGCVIA